MPRLPIPESVRFWLQISRGPSPAGEPSVSKAWIMAPIDNTSRWPSTLARVRPRLWTRKRLGFVPGLSIETGFQRSLPKASLASSIRRFWSNSTVVSEKKGLGLPS